MRIFTGNLEIEGWQSPDSFEMTYKTVRDSIDIRSTFVEDKFREPGGIQRDLTITYFTSANSAASAISETALRINAYVEAGDVFEVSGTFLDGPVTTLNPRYTWQVYAFEGGFGGTQEEASTMTTTLSVVGPPVVEFV